jgi:predicted permease
MMIRFNLKIALRNLMKNKVFSLINISGLTISLASCILISIFIWSEWQHDRFHEKKERIYRVTNEQVQAGQKYTVAVTPGPMAPTLEKDFPEVEAAVRLGRWSGILQHANQNVESGSILMAENSFFRVFDFKLLKGDPKTVLSGPDEIVINERMAATYFGKDWADRQDIIGQLFRLNDEADFKLTGIVQNAPENSSIDFEVLLPLNYLFTTDEFSNKWNSNNYHTYVLLRKDADAKAFAVKVEKQLQKYNPDTKDLLRLQPLTHQYLRSAFDFNTDWGKRSNINYIRIFFTVGLVLLIIACINFINLSTARSLKRSMEVGIRKVTGASRGQLIRQFLMESVLMAVISGILSVLLLKLFQPMLVEFSGYAFSFSLLDQRFLAIFTAFIILVGLVAGMYPAFILSSFKPIIDLKNKKGSGSGAGFRKGLVVFQFTVSIVLIVVSYFIFSQLNFMQKKDLGFDKAQLINVGLGGKLGEKAMLFKQELQRSSSIKVSAPATISMVNVGNSSYLEWEGMQESDKFLVTQANIDPDFIPALGLSLLSGQNFTPQVTNDTATYIVNESTARQMGYTQQSILGKEVIFWGNKGRIIGVVKDFHFKPMTASIAPFIFRYQPQDRYFTMMVKSQPGRTADALNVIQQAYSKFETSAPLHFTFVDEAVQQQYSKEKYIANIILGFTLLTIFIGCLGLFGLTVYSIEQRVKEIGIRKVLGASLTTILKLLLKDQIRLIIVAAFVAVPIAWYITSQWLNNYVYRIDMQWWIFGLAGLLVTMIAVATISYHAMKSARANPVESLRSE